MPQPGLYTVVASSEAWPNAGSQAERMLTTAWLLDQAINSTGGEATNAGPSTAAAFLSTGDGTTGSGTSFYALGRRLRVVHNGGTSYCEVGAASYSTTATQTTITIRRVTSGTTNLSTGSITSVAAGPIWNSTDGVAYQFPPFLYTSSGAVTDPSLHIGYDSTGTGFYQPGTNRIGIAIASTGVWEFSTAGHLLTASGNAYDIAASGTAARTGYFGTSVFTPLIDTPAATDMTVRAAGVARLTVYANGATKTVMWDANGGAQLNMAVNTADATGHLAANSRTWQTT